MTRKVIDDQNDYYSSSNRWLSEKARQILKQKEELDEKKAEEKEKPKNTLIVDFDDHGRMFIPKTFEDFDKSESTSSKLIV